MLCCWRVREGLGTNGFVSPFQRPKESRSQSEEIVLCSRVSLSHLMIIFPECSMSVHVTFVISVILEFGNLGLTTCIWSGCVR